MGVVTGAQCLGAGEMIARMHFKGTRGPVGRSLEAGLVREQPVGRSLGCRYSLGRNILDAGEMIAARMHFKRRGPVGRSLGAGWVHEGPVGRFWVRMATGM